MPISRAMAEAVTTWSPVIIMGRMPAAMHWATACLDSGRGGSIMAIRPRKMQVVLVLQGDGWVRLQPPAGEGQHPQALVGEFLR